MGDVISDLLGTNSSASVAQQPIQTHDWMNGWTGSLLDQYSANTNSQKDLANQFGQVATGQNSPLQQLANSQANQNAQQAAGVYANNRAINPALAARQASNLQSQANQGVANTLAMQRLGAMGQQGQIYGQLGHQIQGMQGLTQGAIANQNQAINQSNATAAGVAGNNQQMAGKAVGGVFSALAPGMGMMSGGGGGGGAPGGDFSGANGGMGMGSGASAGGPMDMVASNPEILAAAHGGQIPRMSRGGQCHRNPMIMAQQGFMNRAQNMKGGGSVPGQAKIQGDSLKNDTVPAMLSPGEIVVPRSKASDPDAARNFVAAVLKRKGAIKR